MQRISKHEFIVAISNARETRAVITGRPCGGFTDGNYFYYAGNRQLGLLRFDSHEFKIITPTEGRIASCLMSRESPEIN